MHETILIADPAAASRMILRSRLAEAHYQPLVASDPGDCLQMAVSAQPAIIVIDGRIGGGQPGDGPADLIARLRREALTAALPIILLCDAEDMGARLAGLQAGADDVLARMADTAILLARIRNLLRRGQPSSLLAEAWGREQPALQGFAEQLAGFQHAGSIGGSIGVIAERRETALAWRQRIPAELRTRAHVPPPRSGPPVAVLHDVYLIAAPDGDSSGGLHLLSQLAAGHGGQDSLCCLVLAHQNNAAIALAYDLGADDVIDPEVTGAELELRLQNMLRRKAQRDRDQQKIRDGLRFSLIDPLTGVWNRRYALPRLSALCNEARSTGQPLAVMVVDIDRFKRVNDMHGHHAGDQILAGVVQRLSVNLRAGDLLARIGGEEFLLVLPGTGVSEGGRIADRLRRLISDQPFALEGGASGDGSGSLTVTISLGLRVSSGNDHPQALIEAADEALRQSKRDGRNIVTLCQSLA